MSAWFVHGIVASSGSVGGGAPAAALDAWANVLTTRSGTTTYPVSAGDDRLLLVSEYTRAGVADPVTALTYGNQPMTKVVGQATTTGPDLDSGLWYLNDAGIAAATDAIFRITPSTGSVQFRLAAGTYENVDQTTPVVDNDSSVNNSGASPVDPTLTSIVDGLAVVGLYANRGTSDGAPTEDATYVNMTERVEQAATQSYMSVADAATDAVTFTPDTTLVHATSGHLLGLTLGPTGTGGGGGNGGGGGALGSKIPLPPVNLGFDNGSAIRYVTQDGTSNPIGGETATTKHTTIAAAMAAANPNDVVLIRSGTYYESSLQKTNFAGTPSTPLWIVAEERGQVTVSALWQAADEGQASLWTSDGGGVWFASHGKTYIGSHGDDFLMHYITEADLRAASVSGVTKPTYGMAVVTGENRIYVRLRGDINPNGQNIKIPDAISQTIFDFNNSDNIILDGLIIEGAGNTPSVEFDSACANPVVRNCVFTHCRFGVRCQDNTTLYVPEYRMTGFGAWCAEVLALDGKDNNGPFTLAKTYLNAAAIGEAGGTGNAILEGGLDVGTGSGAAVDNVLIDLALIRSCFDGSKIGRHNNSKISNTVFEQCRDDGFEDEGLSALQPSDGNEIHDSRFIDCFVGGSHQASFVIGETHVYRCVFENRDTDFQHNTLYVLKMLQTAAAAQIHYYQCTFVNISAPGASNQWIWYDFSNGTGDRIRNFLNNIVIYPGEFSSGAGPEPVTKNGNALVAPAANASLQGGAGVYAGTAESDMGLNADYSLPVSSPAAGIGVTLPAGFPDTGANNDDAGAFPVGVAVGVNWPRERVTAFDFNPPSQFVT